MLLTLGAALCQSLGCTAGALEAAGSSPALLLLCWSQRGSPALQVPTAEQRTLVIPLGLVPYGTHSSLRAATHCKNSAHLHG